MEGGEKLLGMAAELMGVCVLTEILDLGFNTCLCVQNVHGCIYTSLNKQWCDNFLDLFEGEKVKCEKRLGKGRVRRSSLSSFGFRTHMLCDLCLPHFPEGSFGPHPSCAFLGSAKLQGPVG